MAKAFDKDSWLAQKEQRLRDAKAALEEGLKALQTSDDWRRVLEGMAQVGAFSVRHYSFQNQMLIWHQRPGTKLAASFQTWKENGRFVRKGEKGITILAPVVKKIADDQGDHETRSAPFPLAAIALVTNVVIYTPINRYSAASLLIGAVAGAIPPLMAQPRRPVGSLQPTIK